MSLTSYRAAPPRDKPLRSLIKKPVPRRQRLRASIDPVRRLPEKANPEHKPLGRERYVPTQGGFGKARSRSFIDFVTPGALSVLMNQNRAPVYCFDAFSSREPASTSLENAIFRPLSRQISRCATVSWGSCQSGNKSPASAKFGRAKHRQTVV